MKKLFLILLSTLALNANWQTNIKLNHIKLSDAYVKAVKANTEAKLMCRQQIALAQDFRDNMDTSESDKKILQEYLFLVKEYCSQVAGCNCKRDN